MKKSILLLAAGQSRRMRGRDKLLEPIDGVPLIRLQAQRALQSGCPVYVTLPSLDHARAEALGPLEVFKIPVADAASGIAASLRAGLAAIPENHSVLIHLADLVEVQAEDLQAVLRSPLECPQAKIWRAATMQGAPGHPILIAPTLRRDFAQLIGDNGGASILKQNQGATQLVRLPGDRVRLDLDTPEDWAAWRANTPKK